MSPGPSGGSSPLQALCLEGTTATRELLEVTPPPLPLPLAQERSWDVSSESVFFPLHCPTPSWGGKGSFCGGGTEGGAHKLVGEGGGVGGGGGGGALA